MDTVQSFKCPCCNAALPYNGAVGGMKCEYCGSEFSAETLEKLMGEDASALSSDSKYNWESYTERSYDADESVNLADYTCPSCGAEITGDSTLGATICPYCGNGTIIKKTFEGAAKPDYVIPFKITKEEAIKRFSDACGKAPFLPKEFKDVHKIEEMAGVYVPFWMFDCTADADISYKATRVKHWSTSDYNYTKTDHYRVYRSGNVSFANIPADGSKKADDTYMEAVEPYDYSEAVDFNAAYLSGYLADRYDVTAEECEPRANERVKKSTEEAFAATVTGYSTVATDNSSIRFTDGKIRYSLMPVWMLNIKYKDIVYKYAINGQTGKTVGEFPVDKKKKWLYFFKVYAISLAVIAGGMFLLANM